MKNNTELLRILDELINRIEAYSLAGNIDCYNYDSDDYAGPKCLSDIVEEAKQVIEDNK